MKTLFERATIAALLAAGTAAFAACSSTVPQEPATAAAPANASSSAAPAPTPGETDAEFVRAAVQVEAGRYALGAIGAKRASAASLRALAHGLSSDAAASSRWLNGYAKKRGIRVDARPKTRALYQYSQLTQLRGAAFDRSYAQAINTDASLSLDTFQSEAVAARDPALRAFAKRAAAQLRADAARAQAFSAAT